VQLTEKGADLRGKLAELFDTQVEQLDESSRLDGDELTEMIRMLKAMERFWGDMTRFVR
jgi:flagellin-specific chaperone FliS